MHDKLLFTFTFMHSVDAFIQSDVQRCTVFTFYMRAPWGSNPQPFGNIQHVSLYMHQRKLNQIVLGLTFIASCGTKQSFIQ